MVRKVLYVVIFAFTVIVATASGAKYDQQSAHESAGMQSRPLPIDDRILVAATSAPTPEPGELLRDCPDCPELVVVPPGDFEMGSSDSPFEKPQHQVSIAKSFAIGRREISFREWDACVTAGSCKTADDDRGWGRGEQPVINVSWDDAMAFVTWLSQKTGRPYRLPSEAEWEYAARAGTKTKYWWGRDVGKGNANCDDCGATPVRKALPGGSYRPNGFGLYDTSGNMYEWVADCWNDDYNKAPKDGSPWNSGQCQQRVIRGGSFANKSNAATSSARFRYDRDVRYYANGFRVVRDLQ
jgi:formylglycine-generating enzyme required for sulfatase activity